MIQGEIRSPSNYCLNPFYLDWLGYSNSHHVTFHQLETPSLFGPHAIMSTPVAVFAFTSPDRARLVTDQSGGVLRLILLRRFSH